jgi:hypothetical protein
MNTISENAITFSETNTTGRGREFYQSILYKGTEIGVLVTTETSILKPLVEHYQINADEKNADLFAGFELSEDEGKILGYFFTLESFLKYYSTQQN